MQTLTTKLGPRVVLTLLALLTLAVTAAPYIRWR